VGFHWNSPILIFGGNNRSFFEADFNTWLVLNRENMILRLTQIWKKYLSNHWENKFKDVPCHLHTFKNQFLLGSNFERGSLWPERNNELLNEYVKRKISESAKTVCVLWKSYLWSRFSGQKYNQDLIGIAIATRTLTIRQCLGYRLETMNKICGDWSCESEVR